ncbi:alpha subunit of the translation initiation factor eif2b [Lobosporangium transversale]|uniref:Translation initiation factor eIF2B subunit alpha n=1 Tax=Lobosporangium transversale TaxID=64571 RepID=A0A1Y2GIE5_9FUNG|nr:alpha subunit of the translation initiation factor eif2b [Lobosporangium transversale]ORZ11714.1 alpha subunit of the translation initiation factor eif2b [Lobosporangium transversale]|eukprot:XP_021879811.1 alpha subunit of the translation initiation factor eif2b [Lobosporangium transversale]
MAENFDVVTTYKSLLLNSPELSMPVAAIQSLVELIKHSKATTMSEFMLSIKDASQQLKSSVRNSISLSAENSQDVADFEIWKKTLIIRGQSFVEKADACRYKIADLGVPFIKDGSVVLIHAHSRVVSLLLQKAAENHKRFKVFVTESSQTQGGIRSAKVLRAAGIPTTIILDAAVGYVIDKVDMVLVGLINQIGSYQMAIVAKAANKPFYAVAESYKFVRLFPLNQYDLPTYNADTLSFQELNVDQSSLTKEDGTIPAVSTSSTGSAPSQTALHMKTSEDRASQGSNPLVDYTPPSYITLLFTDLGVLTPSGVSDELIKLYL